MFHLFSFNKTVSLTVYLYITDTILTLCIYNQMWKHLVHRNSNITTSISKLFNFSSKPISQILHSQNPTLYSLIPTQKFNFNSSFRTKTNAFPRKEEESSDSSSNGKSPVNGSDYPSGEFEFKKRNGWDSFLLKMKLLVALPWLRVRNGSVLSMKLRGKVSLSLPVVSCYVAA